MFSSRWLCNEFVNRHRLISILSICILPSGCKNSLFHRLSPSPFLLHAFLFQFWRARRGENNNIGSITWSKEDANCKSIIENVLCSKRKQRGSLHKERKERMIEFPRNDSFLDEEFVSTSMSLFYSFLSPSFLLLDGHIYRGIRCFVASIVLRTCAFVSFRCTTNRLCLMFFSAEPSRRNNSSMIRRVFSSIFLFILITDSVRSISSTLDNWIFSGTRLFVFF